MEATVDRVRPDDVAPEPGATSAAVAAPASAPSDAGGGDVGATEDVAPTGVTTGFADLEHARSAWSRTARAAGAILADFDFARARSRNDATALDGETTRLVTVSPDGDDALLAAVPWTIARLGGPFRMLRIASTAGATTGVLPAPILFRDGTTVARAASAWRGILGALDEASAPAAVEIGPLPLDGTAWAGLLAGLGDERLDVRLAATRTVGAWVRLPVHGGGTWPARVRRDLHRLRRELGPERTVILDDAEAIRTELHEADRTLRRAPGGGFSTVPGGRQLAEGLLRAADGETDSPRPLAVRLEHDGRVIGRAIALVRGQRAVVLAVACTRELPWGRHAPGRLVFAQLVDALRDVGVTTVEAGPAAVWFAAREPDAVAVPLLTVLLVRRSGDRTSGVERVIDLVGRMPGLGPVERFVRRLRPWVDAIEAASARDEGPEDRTTPAPAEDAAALEAASSALDPRPAASADPATDAPVSSDAPAVDDPPAASAARAADEDARTADEDAQAADTDAHPARRAA